MNATRMKERIERQRREPANLDIEPLCVSGHDGVVYVGRRHEARP